MRRRRRVRGHQPTRHAGPCQQWQVKTSGSMTVCTTSSELPASADCSLGCMPEPCTPSASMCLKSCVRLGNSCGGASQAWRRHERGVRSGWHAATLGMRYRYSTLRHGTTGRLGARGCNVGARCGAARAHAGQRHGLRRTRMHIVQVRRGSVVHSLRICPSERVRGRALMRVQQLRKRALPRVPRAVRQGVRAWSRCRRGRGGPSPGADVAEMTDWPPHSAAGDYPGVPFAYHFARANAWPDCMGSHCGCGACA